MKRLFDTFRGFGRTHPNSVKHSIRFRVFTADRQHQRSASRSGKVESEVDRVLSKTQGLERLVSRLPGQLDFRRCARHRKTLIGLCDKQFHFLDPVRGALIGLCKSQI